jgi:uncharacterized damage-inducible protein DinB
VPIAVKEQRFGKIKQKWATARWTKRINMPLSESVLARLRYQHETIRELIGNLSEQQLRQRIDPAKWSAFENIAHLACYQPVFLNRIQRMQAESNPLFTRYRAEDDPEFPGYVEQSLGRLLATIQTDRQTLINGLAAMDETRLQRLGQHPRYGQFPLAKWVEFFLLHESHHLYTIFMMVQDLRRNLPE